MPTFRSVAQLVTKREVGEGEKQQPQQPQQQKQQRVAVSEWQKHQNGSGGDN